MGTKSSTMEDEDRLRWPYGFRFEWRLKKVHRPSTGPNDDSNEPSIKIRPALPSIREILRNIPDQVGDQLQSTLVSMSTFRDSLSHLQISTETQRIVLQRVLGDMAGNEREALLSASSWWRQKALEHGPSYVDALISHVLHLNLTTDMSTDWEVSRKESDLKWETEDRNKRIVTLLATVAEHTAEPDATSSDSGVVEAYLARAEVIRELMIYANKKICETVSAKEDGQDMSVDCLIGTLLSNFNDNDVWKTTQLEKCKRVASIIQLNDLCEQNNWSLVACHVETDDLSGRPKLFRRLLNVVSKLEDDPTRAKALVRPAVQPFPMFILSEYKSSDKDRSNLNWKRCSPEEHAPARCFYPQNSEYKELQNKFGRHGKDCIARPQDMAKSLERKVELFDFFDEQDDRVINAFAHFRHIADDLIQLLGAVLRPVVLDENSVRGGSQAETRNDSPATRTSLQANGHVPDTPTKLIVHPYQDAPTHTPPTTQKRFHGDTEEATTPTRAELVLDGDFEAQIELMRSDLATLFRALLTAHDIDMMEGNEAISAKLSMSRTFTKITIDRLLENPIFQERYGIEGAPIEDAMPDTQPAVKALMESLIDDTAVLLYALLASRGIDIAVSTSVIVNQLTSPLIPEEVAERALANPRVKARRRRKRKVDEAAALRVKREIKVEREPR